MTPDLVKIRQKITADPYAKHMGIELVELKKGYAKLKMTVKEHMVNFHGIPHGGAIFTLADQAFAASCNSHGTVAVALNVNISFLAAATVGSVLYAEGKEINRTRRTGLYQIEITNQENQLLANFQGLAYIKEQPLLGD
jgi:acyl-CoA thioesterase